jgi:hypothetical protein
MLAAEQLCAEFDIQIIPVRERRVGRQTHAGRTIERLIADYGGAHARLVLMSIVDTGNNETEVRAETIGAVSDILWARPDWEKRGSDWLAALDQIDLKALLAKAKTFPAYGSRTVLGVLLHSELERQFALQDRAPADLTAVAA